MIADTCQCVPRCTTRTETVAGLEFITPTWCSTPRPWNSSGAWVDNDPEIAERVLAGIKARVPNWLELRNESLAVTLGPVEQQCRTFWGSHGCSLKEDHSGLCNCEGHAAMLRLDDQHAITWWNDAVEPSVLSWTWYR